MSTWSRFGSFGFGVVAAVIGAATAGCAGGAQVAPPPGVPVSALVTDSLTLHGTAEATLSSATCTGTAPSAAKHVIHLNEDARLAVLLGPEKGHPFLPISVLHITHLDSNRTWCVMTKADGTPAALAAEFPSGMYAVSVSEAKTVAPQRYEITVEKL